MISFIMLFIQLDPEGSYRSLGKKGKYTNHPRLYEDFNTLNLV